jgi:hypothetical protein
VRQYAAEFWRVLRDDGIFWLNLGDSYAGSGGAGEWSKRKAGKKEYAGPRNNANRVVKSLPAKNLIGTPWRCALALQADGWTLRAAPPWIKKNPMPESTKDRPNTGHEYWFMLTKGSTCYADMNSVRQPATNQKGRAAGFVRENPGPDVPGQLAKQHRKDRNEPIRKDDTSKKLKKYYSDMEAVRQPNADPKRTNYAPGKEAYKEGNVHDNSGRTRRNDGFQAYAEGKTCHGRHWRTGDFTRTGIEQKIADHKAYVIHLENVLADGGMLMDESGMPEALLFNTRGFGAAHFATFNPDMIEPIIKFSTSEHGVCPRCGAPWTRIIEKGYRAPVDEAKIAEMEAKGVPRQKANLYGPNTREPHLYENDPDKTTGWEPSCECDIPDPVPAIVADFFSGAGFSGAGTTAMVANQLGRVGVGLELSMEYIKLAENRTQLAELRGWVDSNVDGAIVVSKDLTGLPMFEELG